MSPMGVSAMKTVTCLKERNDFFHTCQPIFPADVAAVDTCQQNHDAEAASARSNYVLVIFRIDSVHVDALARQSAVGFGTILEVFECSALHGVHQGVVAQPVCLGIMAFALSKAQQRED